MNLEVWEKRRGRLVLLAVSLGVLNLVVGLVPVLRASPMGSRNQGSDVANAATEEEIRHFAGEYVSRLENYTPSTVEGVTKGVMAWIAPGFWSRASEALQHRVRMSVEGRISSQAILGSFETMEVRRGEEIEVSVPVIRRTYLADKVSLEAPVTYRLRIVAGVVAAGNPHGLYVAGQEIDSEERHATP